MTVDVVPDPAHHAGHALLRVRGAAGVAPGFHLRRPPGWEEGNLGPDGWQVADALLEPDGAEARGSDLVLRIGPRVCAHLEGGSYLFELPAAGVSEVVAWPDIPYMAPPSAAPPLPSPAPSQAVPAPMPVPPTAEAPAPVPAPPAADPQTVARSEATTRLLRKPPRQAALPPPRRTASRLSLLLGLLVLVAAVAAGGGWYAWQRLHPAEPGPQADATPPQPQPPRPQPTQPRPPDSAPPSVPPRRPPAPPPISLAGLPVPDVIARAPDAAAIRTEGERRLGGEQKDDGLLLLEAAAVRGNAAALAALAKLYDPLGFAPGGPIPAPDARQAAKYYRDADRAGDTSSRGRRDALRALLEQRAQGGDFSATLMLRDYWP